MEEVSEAGEGAEAEETSNLLEEIDEGGNLEEEDGNVLRRRVGASARSRFTLSAASRMLRKKIPQSGILMLPRRLWMQTVPTQDCEVVILFSPSCNESTVNWLVSRLKSRVPELVITMKSHLAVNSLVLYVTATMDGLVKGGEELLLSKKTKPEYGSGLRELSHQELNIFQGVEDPTTFFTSEERQSIVLHLLHSLRGVEGDYISGLTFRSGQAIVPKFQNDGLIQQVLPLHEQQLLSRLRATWVQSFFRYQPLDLIKEYFGAKIGIYFSWLGFYTASLTIPAVIGFVFWIYFWGNDQAKEDKAFLVLAFLNVVWGSMWLEAWKRRSAELTHRWGIHEPPHELLEDPSPHFLGELEISPVTGRLEPVYPLWKRNLFRYFVTLPVLILCIGLVFIVMFVILQIQDWVDSVIEYRGLPTLLSYVPKFVMAVTISISDEGYNKIALWLNDMENYRHEESYQNHLIVKLAAFRLVNSFLVLFYIAFYLQDVESLKAQLAALFLTRQIVGNIKESCVPFIWEQVKMAKLSFELFGAISPTAETNVWKEGSEAPHEGDTINHLDAYVSVEKQPPLLDGSSSKEKPPIVDVSAAGKEDTLSSHSEKEKRDDSPSTGESLKRMSSKSRLVSQAEVESNMAKYDDTFEDYLEMFIQFGYVMLFSSAFPLAATCAFVNNLIEIRSDAFKLCFVFQRPFGQRVRSIGVWQDAMEFMCLLGIMVNCMLIGFSGQVHRMFPEMSTTQTVLLIIVLEHAMIALKYGISYAIPDVPESIAQAVAKAEFQRREALKRLSSSNSPPTREESEQSSPKYGPVSNLPSMEYIERSVQTETPTTISRKSSSESRAFKDFGGFGVPTKRKASEESQQETESPKMKSIIDINPESLDSRKSSLDFKLGSDSRKSSAEFRLGSDSRKSSGDFKPGSDSRKSSADSKLESEFRPTVPYLRSIPPFDKTKHATIPKVSKRLNQSCLDNSLHHDFGPRGPSPSESLPVLSAPAHFDNKKRLFNFGTKSEKHSIAQDYTPSPEKESDYSSHTKSTESVAGSTIREESLASDNITETETVLAEEQLPEGGDWRLSSRPLIEGQATTEEWRPSKPKHVPGSHHHHHRPRKSFPSSESLHITTTVDTPPTHEEPLVEGIATPAPPVGTTSTEETIDISKVVKKHPSKFLKRAQSFSQVFTFKRPEKDKKRKHMDTIRDDYSLSLSMAPMGELALVPLEKLVSIEDLRNRMSMNEEK